MSSQSGYIAFKAAILIGAGGFSLPKTGGAAFEPVVAYPDFQNVLRLETTNPGSELSSSVAFFGGTEGAYKAVGSTDPPKIPQAVDTGIQLASSAFGQFIAPRPTNDTYNQIILEAQKTLYPQVLQPNPTREDAEDSGTAFRYKPLLYSPGVDGIRIDLEKFGTWFGEPERALAHAAIEELRRILQQDPLNDKARNTLLDVYYDLAVAELQLIKLQHGTLSEYRLGFKLPPADGFIIDEEIALHLSMLEHYDFILQGYGGLFRDRMGLRIEMIDTAAPSGIPLGSYIFRAEQSVRSQNASQFIDADGVLRTVPQYDVETGLADPTTGTRTLFAAFKDYVTILSILRDEARIAADLVRLYAMRGRHSTDPANDDRTEAYYLIDRTQAEIQQTLVLLDGLLPELVHRETGTSGIAAARDGIQVALSDLGHARAFLDGKANLLGFDPDFLVLIQEFPDSTSGNQFDSYDALVRWIRNTDTSPLSYAEKTFERAFTNYEKYQGFADQMDIELSAINSTYERRYWEITGYEPSEGGDHFNEPHAGSELAEVALNIEHANRSAATLKELEALGEDHEQAAAETLASANRRISAINAEYEDYKKTISDNRDIITHWNAAQAGMQAIYDMTADLASLDPGYTLAALGSNAGSIAVAGALNVVIQTAGEEFKGHAEKALDLGALEWEKTTEMADAELVVAQAQDARNDLLRERKSSALQSNDVHKIQTQEHARRANLLNEAQRILQKRDESKVGLSGRYYADPIHFLRAQNDMIVADLAFEQAQKWVFFTARALEFKWNKPFVMSHLGKDWETATLFGLRNYQELEQMVGAMEQFNTVNLVGFNREPFVDRISLRDDILARAPTEDSDDDLRIDLETGDMVTASELLRRKLDRTRDDDGNYIIRLNTFILEQDGGLFFLGPEYRSDGSVLSAGRYLDKIDWIKIKVVTGQSPGVRTANLAYGGTCYIRTRVPPCGDPANPLAMPGEYRVFPFRYFLTLDNGQSWEARPAQEDTVKLILGPTSGEPDAGVTNSTYENRFLKERSVATTDWELSIPAGALQLSELEDIEFYIRHLFVSRDRPACP